ncbi:MAG: hypothetical protein MUF00_02250 [Gemmatimonadaceae bacterium]|jgi:hypothetical protein|nr:hypothetical protein [Gemmatimonadaceae bacterium]
MQAPTPNAPTDDAAHAPRALVTRLTVAFNRRRAYPVGHPLVRSAEQQAYEELRAVLSHRPSVAFGVGRDELLIDDKPAEDAGAVARELAERLRLRGIGCVTFDTATTIESLQTALAWLASDPKAAAEGDLEQAPAMPGVSIAKIAYGRLALGDGATESATNVDAIWRALAAVALLNGTDEAVDGSPLMALTDVDDLRVTRTTAPGSRAGDSARGGAGSDAGGSARDARHASGAEDTRASDAGSGEHSAPGAMRDVTVIGGATRASDGSAGGGGGSGVGSGGGSGGGVGGGGTAEDGGPSSGEGSSSSTGVGGAGAGSGGAASGALGGGGAGDASGDGSASGAEDGVAIATDIALAATEPTEVAHAIERRIGGEGYAKRVAYVLLRVAGQVAQAPPEQRALLGERLRAVLSALKSSSLRAIIKSVGVGTEQRRFIAEMIDALPVAAIVEWLETAAQASGQDLSHHLLRIIGKLSSRAYAGGVSVRPDAESAFRGAAHELVRGWSLEDPNPVEHVALLDHISVFDHPVEQRALEDTGASRLVQLALEIDAFGEDTAAAVDELIRAGRVSDLYSWLIDAPGVDAASAIRAHLVSPAAVRAVLLRDPLDQATARTMLASLDQGAADILLDVLRDATGRTTRRMVYDRLRELGPAIAPLLTRRLDGAAWYFVRNLLALLRDLGSADGGQADATVLFHYLDHTHEQVRIEALRLLVADALTRDAAVRRALGDGSDRVVRVALEALSNVETATRRALAPELVQRLLKFIDAGEHADELVARAVRSLLDAAPSAVVRDALLGLTTRRTLVLRRLALVEARAPMLAALEVLAMRYGRDARGAQVIDLASRAADRRVRDAVLASTARPFAAAS